MGVVTPERPVALVGAEHEGAADALQADLLALQYEVVAFQLDRANEHPPGALAVLATSGALTA